MTTAPRAPYMDWFPYTPRPHQDRAVEFATTVFTRKTVGLLSADCGVGKTIAVLSGYLAARADDPDFRLIVLTRTHSQSVVFEEELDILRRTSGLPLSVPLTATSMVSRVHMCPIKEKIKAESPGSFMKACATMIKTDSCHYYWDFYTSTLDGRHKVRDKSLRYVESLILTDVVTRECAEEALREHGFCPYEVLRWAAKKSRVVIGPYAYLFHSGVREALLSSLECNLSDVDILVDEAHNLGDHVLDSESALLTGDDIKTLRSAADVQSRTLGAEWVSEGADFLHQTLSQNFDSLKTGGEKELDSWEVVPRFIKEADLNALLRKYEANTESADVQSETPEERMARFFLAGLKAQAEERESGSGREWHTTLDARRSWKDEARIPDVEFRIRPLNAAGFAAKVLRGARSAILMSGTLNPLDYYSSLLGVGTAMRESVASPYPSGSRLILVDKGLTTKYTERTPNLMSRIAKRISAFLTCMPANKSSLIAFPSYKLMEEILSYGVDCGYRDRIVERPRARIEELKDAVEASPHAVFCVYGGKYSEGIDLVKGGSSLVDAIVGVGIPFGPPTSYNNALRDWYERRFDKGAGYYYSSVIPAVRKVAQLVGRLRRAPDDWGIILLLDWRFQNHIGIFSDDFVSDIWSFSETEEMEYAITEYLKTRGVGRN
ncbi:MAG: ATP-dependent DNA helicase [Candidatus Thorarchaeota archaeon]